jgi:hypothetical protein
MLSITLLLSKVISFISPSEAVLKDTVEVFPLGTAGSEASVAVTVVITTAAVEIVVEVAVEVEVAVVEVAVVVVASVEVSCVTVVISGTSLAFSVVER